MCLIDVVVLDDIWFITPGMPTSYIWITLPPWLILIIYLQTDPQLGTTYYHRQNTFLEYTSVHVRAEQSQRVTHKITQIGIYFSDNLTL